MSYKVIKGDVTRPQGPGIKIIPHICNDIGGWGAGVVLAISKRWGQPERRYREWAQSGKSEDTPFELGQVQFVRCNEDIIVANMIGQHRVAANSLGRPPIRYVSLTKAMMRVHGFIKGGESVTTSEVSIHCPKFGSGLAGGNWEAIEQLIHEVWVDKGLNVIVYEYP